MSMRLRQLMKVKFNTSAAAALFAVSCLSAGQASAQSYLSPGYIMGEIRDGLGIVKPAPAPDFVVRGRPDPASLEYTTLKPPPRGFHTVANTPSGRLAAEAPAIAELEKARAGAAAKSASKPAAPVEEDPPPMKWNAWDTE